MMKAESGKWQKNTCSRRQDVFVKFSFHNSAFILVFYPLTAPADKPRTILR